MKLYLLLLFIPIKILAFQPISKEFYTSKWSYVTDEVLSLRKSNPLYFRNQSIEEQISLSHWQRRLDDLDRGAHQDISRRDYFKKKLVVGKIIASIGDLRVNREGGKVKGDVKFIYQGDIIETKLTGSCWVTFLDGTMLRLSPDSSISISEIIFNSNSFEAFIRVNKGEVFGINRFKDDSFLSKGRFLDLSFLSIFKPDLVERVLAYFSETIYTENKMAFSKILKLMGLYTNDFRFENWKLDSSFSFYNENMFVTISSSKAHFFVGDSASYLKVTQSIENAPAPKYTPVKYDGEQENLKPDKWYRFLAGEPSESDYMIDKEYPMKMLVSNITPFYLLRESFMNKYSYYISNLKSFPTIQNFSNFRGDQYKKRRLFVSDFLKKSETTFRGVKVSYLGKKRSDFSSSRFRNKYHKTDLRLMTLRRLNVLDPGKSFGKNRLLYSGLLEYTEQAKNIINKLLTEALYSEANTEYLSRQ